MPELSGGDARSAWVGRANLVMAVMAGIFLVAMVVTVTAGVVTRYVFNSPVLGINEVVQSMSVALVMLALPYCTSTGSHVRVDVLDRIIGRWGRFAGDVIARLLSGYVLFVLAQRAFLKALDAHEYEDVTNMIELPVWPFYGALSAGAALCVLTLAFQFILLLTSPGRDR